MASAWRGIGTVVLAGLASIAAGLGPVHGDDAAPTAPLIEAVLAPYTGDLDGMRERRLIRILTAYSPTHYHIVDGEGRGLVAEAARAFEEHVNDALDGPFVSVVVLAAPREQLFDWLEAGHGDIVAANLTVTPERAQRVAFSQPFTTNVSEQVVLGPQASPVASLDDLAAGNVALHVRGESSYAEHLAALNADRLAAGSAAIPVVTVEPRLYDEDLLELVAAGTIPATVIDSHKLVPWREVLPELVVPDGLVIATDQSIAWALRPHNPELLALIDDFVPKVKKGTLLGNIAIKKYLSEGGERLANVRDEGSAQRLRELLEVIQRTADAHGFDWLFLAAQGFQESRLDQSRRSNRGAIGIMQVLPSTAKEPYIALPDIHLPEVNLAAGAKYDRWVIDTYLDDPEIADLDRMLFALAAYNAGPGNLQKARNAAAAGGLDPNRWFDHVELAMARTVSAEPVVYVRNIYAYYSAYKLYVDHLVARSGG